MNTESMTQPSVKQLLNSIIDYAGMFPPSELPFEEAFENYLNYRDSSHSWMLSRFILPSKAIPKVSQFDERIRSDQKAVPFSVLIPGADTLSDYKEEFEKQIRLVHDLKEYFQGLVTADALETKMPEPFFEASDEEQHAFLSDISALLEETGINPTHLFWEPSTYETWIDDVPMLAEAVSTFNQKEECSFNHAFKLRCGGVKPEMVPEVQLVATAIEQCKKHDVAIKFTAGLHHPVRHFNESLDAKMHGFLNVFGASALLFHDEIDAADLPILLSDEHDASFLLDAQTFSWKESSITIKQLIEARDRFCLSFGSCSFEEPIEDLQQLNLL